LLNTSLSWCSWLLFFLLELFFRFSQKLSLEQSLNQWVLSSTTFVLLLIHDIQKGHVGNDENFELEMEGFFFLLIYGAYLVFNFLMA